MPELRQDPVTERWVLLAPERALRPQAFAPGLFHPESFEATGEPIPSAGGQPDLCPFCPGNERMCPEPLLELPQVTHPPSLTETGEGSGVRSSNWVVRVVRNLYPAVTMATASTGADDAGDRDDRGEPRDDNSPDRGTSDMFRRRVGFGTHEVVIESARHVTRMHELTPEEFALTLWAYQMRFRAWRETAGLACGLAFKNNGRAAGASIDHVHSQLIALAHAPPRLRLEWATTQRWYEQRGTCLLCEMVQREQILNQRVVEQFETTLLFCPYASRAPYEMWLVPCQHASDFDQISWVDCALIGRALWSTFQRLERLLPGIGWNYVLHTAPFDTIAKEHYHWHIEIIPRIAQLAGYEWGTDQHINLVAPEQAAQQLRSVLLS